MIDFTEEELKEMNLPEVPFNMYDAIQEEVELFMMGDFLISAYNYIKSP